MKKPFVVIFWGILSWAMLAQSQPEATLFTNGLDAYKNGHYQAAQNMFLRLLQEYPNGRRITATRYMLARSYYKAGDYSRAEVVCKFFFNRHPESSYLDDCHQLLGNTYFKQGDYLAAVDEWMWVMQNSKDPRLKQQTAEYIYRTMDNFFTRQQVEAVRSTYGDNFLDGVARVVIARKMIRNGENSRARVLLREFLQAHPNHFLAGEARALLGASPAGSTLQNQFLYLKTVEGDAAPVAEALALGMQYAMQEYQQRNSGSRAELITEEIESTVASALLGAKESIQEQNPLCLIGPVDPDQSAALAAMSAYEQRPLVIPLSSQTGLTELSRYAFQINPDANTKGQFLGRYAVNDLQLKRLAILAPATEYGENFVKSFVEQVQAGGGTVESLQWYYENSKDFNRQFRAIWRKGLFLAFRDSLLQEDSTLSERVIEREYQTYLEEKFKPRRFGVSVDSTDVPATGIDGLLVVIRSSELIQYMAPQFAFNNIQATLLGNEGWNDPLQLRKFPDYLEGLIFSAAGYFDPDAANYRLFMNRFRNTMKKTPEQFHLLGYDIMSWLLANYSPGLTPTEFRDRLENAPPYQGLVQSIHFGEKPRVNSKLSVLKLNYGRLIRLTF